ncbi:hypothetical protein ACWDAO_30950 [Streptomyces sp. NPDC001212]|uniref:hypothetical protein n=1 Tax=Streptomyces sp. CoT10 TaxID=2875762 RepID=UPI001CD66585|nr:hypothetical protein [Streptomyces sp. CoT10]
MARTGRRQVGPCSVCGSPCLITRVIDTGRGRSGWACAAITFAVWWPSPAMSMTLEGVLADLGEVLAELDELPLENRAFTA